MRKKLEIGQIEFSTKQAAKEFVRYIVSQYADREQIQSPYHEFLCDLLHLHPESESKIGCGISAFWIELDPVWGKTRGFILQRLDGSTTDFSWVSCIDGKSRRSEVLSAMRRAIAGQIVEAKIKALSGNATCEYTKIQLTKENSHVDHAPPKTFANLVQSWLLWNGITLDDVAISESVDNQYYTSLVDANQISSWETFHFDHATLRLVSKEANLSHIRKATCES